MLYLKRFTNCCLQADEKEIRERICERTEKQMNCLISYELRVNSEREDYGILITH